MNLADPTPDINETPAEPEDREDEMPRDLAACMTALRMVLAEHGMCGMVIIGKPNDGASGIYLAADWSAFEFRIDEQEGEGEAIKADFTPAQLATTLKAINGMLDGIDRMKLQMGPRLMGVAHAAMCQCRRHAPEEQAKEAVQK